MQARAHGLSVSSSALCSAELGEQPIKQEPTLEDCHRDLYTLHPLHQHHLHPACTPEQPGTLEGHSNFSEGHYSSQSKAGDVLMEDTLSPVRGGDPLLSSVSPDASKDSSRKSSVSMDENEQGCQRPPPSGRHLTCFFKPTPSLLPQMLMLTLSAAGEFFFLPPPLFTSVSSQFFLYFLISQR